MSAAEIIFGIILLLFSIAITIIVLLQEGHQQDLGAITGGADTFLSKNKARSVDAFLARWTKVIAIGFFILVIAINVYMYFAPKK
ncbi:preprotein translocase subunit SecG [Caproiciproducens sp. LBM24188]|nr:preprotein translocase subunit SecG [Oscillospiraceae bacterium]HHV33032.1 preprotein translocase subunit SecG [Clostridiales bacterium]